MAASTTLVVLTAWDGRAVSRGRVLTLGQRIPEGNAEDWGELFEVVDAGGWREPAA